MATDSKEQTKAEGKAEKAEPRQATAYKAFSIDKNGVASPLGDFSAVGQFAAKKVVAQALAADPNWVQALENEGVTIAVVPEKSYQPELVKIEVPAPRVSIG